MSKYLLIGSTEPYSGKTSVVAGLMPQLMEKYHTIAYWKPLGNCLDTPPVDGIDEDVKFLNSTFNLPANQIWEPILFLCPETFRKYQTQAQPIDYREKFQEKLQRVAGDLVLLEGPGTLDEGSLFNLSLPEIAENIQAKVLLVARFHSSSIIDSLFSAKKRLGDRLIGAIFNDISQELMPEAKETAKFLRNHQQKIPIFGTIPRDELLKRINVKELKQGLEAEKLEVEIIVCEDSLHRRIENFLVGAMNPTQASGYFNRVNNKAVITGSDNDDIQQAAAGTSLQCLILTGKNRPQENSTGICECREQNIPVLWVKKDTFTTVEKINRTFGKLRFYDEPHVGEPGNGKIEGIKNLMQNKENFKFDELVGKL